MPRRSAMHAQPQRTLKRIIKQYGRDLVYDTRRTEALLRDLSGQHRREIFVLVNAQKQRVPAELLTAPAWLPYQAVHSRLARQLQQRLAITEDAADWAVSAWAIALDVAPSPSASLWGKLTNVMPIRPPSGDKSRRQVKQSGVQSRVGAKRTASQGRRSARRTRAQRAEFGWQIPTLGVTIPPWTTLRTTLRNRLTGFTGLSGTGHTGWKIGGLIGAAVLILALVSTGIILVTRAGDNLDNLSQGAPSVGVAATATAGPIETPEVSTNPPSELPALDPNVLLETTYPTPRFAQVSVDGLLIRQGPSTGFDYVSMLALREAVRVVGYSEDGTWSEIDQPQAGWVSNDYLTFQSPDEGASVQLRVGQVRTRNYETVVRAAPRPNAAQVTTLAPNQPVIVVAVSANSPNNWLQIAEPSPGWLAGQDALWQATQ